MLITGTASILEGELSLENHRINKVLYCNEKNIILLERILSF